MIPAYTASYTSALHVDRQQRNQRLRVLLIQAACGDVRAFEQVYLLTSRWMLSRVRGLVGESLAEDVLGDAYLQVWRTLHTFDAERGEPMAWLMTIARTRALDRLRNERACHGGRYEAPAETADLEQSHTDGPEQLLELAQARASAQACLSSLSPKERMVMGLAYYADLSHSEISSQTGLPLGSVKTLMTRSQQKLRLRLMPHAAMVQSAVSHSAQPMLAAAP